MIIGPLFTSRSKVELRNRSLANPGRLAQAGVTIAITTDHPVVPIHFLVHQAAFAVREGLDATTALEALTINPARIAGIDDRLGSIEVGKDGDVVIWSGDPLNVLNRAAARVRRRRPDLFLQRRGDQVFADRNPMSPAIYEWPGSTMRGRAVVVTGGTGGSGRASPRRFWPPGLGCWSAAGPSPSCPSLPDGSRLRRGRRA